MPVELRRKVLVLRHCWRSSGAVDHSRTFTSVRVRRCERQAASAGATCAERAISRPAKLRRLEALGPEEAVQPRCRGHARRRSLCLSGSRRAGSTSVDRRRGRQTRRRRVREARHRAGSSGSASSGGRRAGTPARAPAGAAPSAIGNEPTGVDASFQSRRVLSYQQRSPRSAPCTQSRRTAAASS